MRSGRVELSITTNMTARGLHAWAYDWARMSTTIGTIVWSSNDTDSFADDFHFNTDTLYATSWHSRFFGFPLRCLSTAVEGEERWESNNDLNTKN